MENTNLPNDSSQSAPTMPAPRRVSGARIAAGVLVCIFTLLVTAVLLFMSICFGLVFKSSSGFSNAPWIFALFLVTILVPIGGTWLAVRLFRGPKKSPAAGIEAVAPTPVFISTVPPKEAEERLAYLRLVILVAILAHAALLVLNLSRYRGTDYHVSLTPIILNFVLFQIPYVIVLVGIRSRAERWALSLALMFPVLAACFTAFSFLTFVGRWLSHPGGVFAASLATILLHFGLSIVIDVVVFILAWRAWQAGRTGDDAVQLVVWGLVSGFYLFLVQTVTPFLYRLVHF